MKLLCISICQQQHKKGSKPILIKPTGNEILKSERNAILADGCKLTPYAI
jgi:hypothetical protein